VIVWNKKHPIETRSDQIEVWVCETDDEVIKCDLHVKRGKPFDVTSLKSDIINNFADKVKEIRSSRIDLYKQKDRLEIVDQCPICTNNKSKKSLVIYHAEYHQCQHCSHYYIKYRPTLSSFKEFYSKDISYQKTYADKTTIEKRINEIAAPKAKWAIGQYKKIYGEHPKNILDVGAGSGHFVEACNRLGVKTTGVEISKLGVEFAHDYLNIELMQIDFTNDWQKLDKFDLVTFWGVIEHTHYPVKMLSTGKKILNDKGIIIAGVPRWNCFSTAVQRQFSNTVIRHLEPLGHINCFTDSSLATALILSGFYPRAAWYYGMDFYELIMQLSMQISSKSLFDISKNMISVLQNSLDMGLLSDSMVLLGVVQNN